MAESGFPTCNTASCRLPNQYGRVSITVQALAPGGKHDAFLGTPVTATDTTDGHILGVVCGAMLALLVFILLLVFLIIRLAFRAMGQGMRHLRRYDRQVQQRTQHNYRRARH